MNLNVKQIGIGLVTVFTLLGCQQNTDNNDNMEEGRINNDQTIERTGYNEEMDRENRYGYWDRDINENRNNINRNNNNDQYNVADKAADRITDQIEEIDYAYVLTTGNNAYVAAVLDNDRVNNQNNKRGNNNNRNNNDSIFENQNNDIRNNAGFNRENGEELTNEVKSEIKDIVRSVDRDIDNVYVTTNPDFVDLTNNYIQDLDEGRPVRGLFDQIGNAIERLFPQDR